MSVAEMKAQRDRQLKEAEVIRQLEAIEAQERAQRRIKEQQDVGCTWGFGKSKCYLVKIFTIVKLLLSPIIYVAPYVS